MRSLLAFLRRFRRDREGLAAVEFALIAPIMFTFLIGSVEVSNAMFANRKVTQTASTLADMASQGQTITSTEMEGLFDSASAVMFPLDASVARMRVTSIVADLNGVTTVGWCRQRGGMAVLAKGSPITAPPGMIAPGGSAIYAEIEYEFTSIFGMVIQSTITLTDGFYLRPRRSLVVTWL